MKRLWQVVASACHRNVLLLHRLQQRRLGARARAVDFVGHQELRENRPRNKAKRALARTALVEHLGAENIRRHQIGRELDALRVQPERNAQGVDQLGLGEARHADQERVAAAQDRHQRVFDDALLTEDHRGDRLLDGTDLPRNLLGRADDHVLKLFDTLHHPLAPFRRGLLARRAMCPC
jgi:hypothetical protein